MLALRMVFVKENGSRVFALKLRWTIQNHFAIRIALCRRITCGAGISGESPMVSNPPNDMPRITPHLFYDDVAAAIDWLVKAFGFEIRLRMTDDDGAVVHGEVELKDRSEERRVGKEGRSRGWPYH